MYKAKIAYPKWIIRWPSPGGYIIDAPHDTVNIVLWRAGNSLFGSTIVDSRRTKDFYRSNELKIVHSGYFH